MFSQLIGNPLAKEMLEKMTLCQKLPQVLLFFGPPGVGKGLFARKVAEKLVNSSKTEVSDIHELYPEGKSNLHPISNIREMITEVSLPPFESPSKVFIIYDADKMQSSSSNALLKTLEEPSDKTYIILTSSDESSLLPTIVSRCCKIPFFPIDQLSVSEFILKREKSLEVQEAKPQPSLEKRVSFKIKKEQSSEKEEQSLKKLSMQEIKKVAILSEGSLSKALYLLNNSYFDLIKDCFEHISYSHLQSTLSKLENQLDVFKEEEEKTASNTDLIFEEILYYVREKYPLKLEKAFKDVEKMRRSVRQHVKMRNGLECFFLNFHQDSR